MKVCILGVSGMLGHMLFSELSRYGIEVCGTARGSQSSFPFWGGKILTGVDALNSNSILNVLEHFSPTVVINAIGLIRHLSEGRQPLPCIRINAEFPHVLWHACAQKGIRCIHYSTDCVFDGKAGRPYTEEDAPTAKDIYGLTKYLGEIAGPGALTIRTSIIGPELRGKHSLVEWFLAQEGRVRGFTKAIYIGLPTSEHARILAEYVLPHPELEGLYHVSGEPISKYDLLQLVGTTYGKNTVIEPDESVCEDKRLSGVKFETKTGYHAPAWPDLITAMRHAHLDSMTQWI